MVKDTRRLHRSAVIATLLETRPVSRKRIAERVGISSATITRTVDQLLSEGLVREASEIVSPSRGRREIGLDIVMDRTFVVGVDVGASSTRLVVADVLGGPVDTLSLRTPSGLEAPALAGWVATQVRAVSGDLWPRVQHVAIGLPGAVSSVGEVTNAPNLPQAEGREFADTLVRDLQCDVALDNDANLALLGEMHFGAARGARNAAMLTLGFGLGAGLAIDGRLLRGDRGLIGEFGQLPVGPEGDRLEDLVTGSGILRSARRTGIDLHSPADLFVPEVDPSLAPIRAQFDHALGLVLAAVMVSSEPQVIVIGGGLADAVSPHLRDYREVLDQMLRAHPVLLAAELGALSGAVGGVVVAVQRLYRDLGLDEDSVRRLPQSRDAYFR